MIVRVTAMPLTYPDALGYYSTTDIPDWIEDDSPFWGAFLCFAVGDIHADMTPESDSIDMGCLWTAEVI